MFEHTSTESPDSAQDRGAKHKQLLLRVAEHRDKQAFSQLFDHFAPLLRSFSLARDPGATLVADDLAQEVMIKVWNKAHTYQPVKAAVSTWIFTMARNARIDYMRKNGRFSTDIDPTTIFETIEDDQPDPFQIAQQQRITVKIQQGLNQLPTEQSQVLAKVYLEGKSHQETASELELPLGTVKSRVRLALQKLELILKR